jgi:hypothetical protein
VIGPIEITIDEPPTTAAENPLDIVIVFYDVFTLHDIVKVFPPALIVQVVIELEGVIADG